MKRVFEGIVFERRRIGDNAIGACTTEAFEEFYQSLPIGKATRITAEDLPESKPEEPKPAEPQGWAERYCANYCADPCCDNPQPKDYRGCAALDLIRTEIERVREEEKQAVLNFISAHGLRSGAVEMIAEGIEQNKHREIK